MNKERFKKLLHSTSAISEEQTLALEKVVQEAPYFQAAKALYLKGLKDNNNYKYNKALKETAALTTDRAVLFDYISGFSEAPAKEVAEVQNISEEKSTTTPSTDLKVGAPLEFNQNEAHSFTEWLQLSKLKPIARTPDKNSESNLYKNKDLIDRFIEENPSIQPVKKDIQTQQPSVYPAENARFMTETLAKVYLEQKKYDSAIKAYEILILKYPEKSGFFADQIKKIEYLKNK